MSDRTCTFPDCDRPLKARGWCKRHYQHWQRHGTPGDPGTSPEHTSKKDMLLRLKTMLED